MFRRRRPSPKRTARTFIHKCVDRSKHAPFIFRGSFDRNQYVYETLKSRAASCSSQLGCPQLFHARGLLEDLHLFDVRGPFENLHLSHTSDPLEDLHRPHLPEARLADLPTCAKAGA